MTEKINVKKIVEGFDTRDKVEKTPESKIHIPTEHEVLAAKKWVEENKK